MNDEFRCSLERVVFENKKTLSDYHRSINYAVLDGFRMDLKIANERMLKDG